VSRKERVKERVKRVRERVATGAWASAAVPRLLDFTLLDINLERNLNATVLFHGFIREALLYCCRR